MVLLAEAVVTTAYGTAAAQTPAETQVARAQFQRGIEATEQERWEDAYAAFRRAYELVPASRVLLNLAGAQVRTGRLVEAAESYRRFLREAGDEDAQFTAAARRALEDVERRFARVTVELRGLGPNDRVTVDDVVVRRAALASPYPVNPGQRTVTIERDGEPVAQQSFEVAEGESATVSLTAPEPRAEQLEPGVGREGVAVIPTPGASGPVSGESTTEDHLITSPWLWLAVGVALVAAAVAGGILLFGDRGSAEQPPPYEGNFGLGSYEL